MYTAPKFRILRLLSKKFLLYTIVTIKMTAITKTPIPMKGMYAKIFLADVVKE